jgi:hypothetical protein
MKGTAILAALAAALLAAPAAQADSVFPLMREIAGDRDLPRPYGVGVDLFTLDQDYDIEQLSFTLPGVGAVDTSTIDVDNEIFESDVKFDVWVLPFLNVFGIFGHISGDTAVDLSGVPLQLPVPLGTLDIDYSGQVWGGGATLAFGGEHWFASLTGTYAKSDLSGDFDSDVKSTTWQPRVGYLTGPWAFFVGGYYIDAEERHQGAIALPGLGQVPFDVQLESSSKFNPSAGVYYRLSDRAETTLELGGGDRQTTLFNFTWRFGD